MGLFVLNYGSVVYSTFNYFTAVSTEVVIYHISYIDIVYSIYHTYKFRGSGPGFILLVL